MSGSEKEEEEVEEEEEEVVVVVTITRNFLLLRPVSMVTRSFEEKKV